MVGPLTLEDKRAIDKALELIAGTEKEIIRAKLAGLDVSAQETQLASYKTKLSAIRQAYFPAGK